MKEGRKEGKEEEGIVLGLGVKRRKKKKEMVMMMMMMMTGRQYSIECMYPRI